MASSREEEQMTAADRWRKYKAPYWFFWSPVGHTHTVLLCSAQLSTWTLHFSVHHLSHQLIAADVNSKCAHTLCHQPAVRLCSFYCAEMFFLMGVSSSLMKVNLDLVWNEFCCDYWDCKWYLMPVLFCIQLREFYWQYNQVSFILPPPTQKHL